MSNDMSRSSTILQFDKLYERIPTAGVCFYCGDDAQTGDHVPPLSSVRKREKGSILWLVPSCQQCNHLLGTHQSVDLSRRCQYLHVRRSAVGNPIEVPREPGNIYVWLMPSLHDQDRDLIGNSIEAVSGSALSYIDGRLGGDFRRTVMHFSYHRNPKVARGILAGMLGRALDTKAFTWGFGVIPSMLSPDPRRQGEGSN